MTARLAGATIGELLAGAHAALAHLDAAHRDAEVLLGHALDCSRAALVRDRDEVVDPVRRARFAALVAARARGRPVAQLRGTQEFWSLTLAVDDAVLIPRPESELLVLLALDRLAVAADTMVVDAGTGSGAIALAIAHERPAACVIALDRAPGALAIAARNLRAQGIPNVALVRGDWLAALRNGGVDLMVANPPYVAADDPVLAGPGLAFEPREALASGADGLRDLRRLGTQARRVLRTGGWILLEHGASQGQAVRDWLAHCGFSDITTTRDLAGHERATCARQLE
jgi:release factor glutamine methyltransferase